MTVRKRWLCQECGERGTKAALQVHRNLTAHAVREEEPADVGGAIVEVVTDEDARWDLTNEQLEQRSIDWRQVTKEGGR